MTMHNSHNGPASRVFAIGASSGTVIKMEEVPLVPLASLGACSSERESHTKREVETVGQLKLALEKEEQAYYRGLRSNVKRARKQLDEHEKILSSLTCLPDSTGATLGTYLSALERLYSLVENWVAPSEKQPPPPPSCTTLHSVHRPRPAPDPLAPKVARVSLTAWWNIHDWLPNREVNYKTQSLVVPSPGRKSWRLSPQIELDDDTIVTYQELGPATTVFAFAGNADPRAQTTYSLLRSQGMSPYDAGVLTEEIIADGAGN